MPDLRVMPAEQVADAVTRLIRVRWSWLIADVDRLVDQLGWPNLALGLFRGQVGGRRGTVLARY